MPGVVNFIDVRTGLFLAWSASVLASCVTPRADAPEPAPHQAPGSEQPKGHGPNPASDEAATDPEGADTTDEASTSTAHQVDEGARDTRGLTPKQIQKVVYDALGSIRMCYNRAVEATPELTGIVTVSWRIRPDGSVEGATVMDSTAGDEGLEACVLGEVRKLVFPEAEKGTSVGFPFAFRPAKTESDD